MTGTDLCLGRQPYGLPCCHTPLRHISEFASYVRVYICTMEHLPLLQHQVNPAAGTAKTQYANFIGNVTNLLGQGTSVQRSNGDMRLSRSHATTGIPYAISGTATVVQSTVSAKLATFVDPIKAILGTAVHETQRIIIKRKYVAGGGAHIVPEHASARTVAIREDIREVMLSRYGNDIEMNLNLFLRPKEAEEELRMKLEASQLALEKRLIRIGYEAVLSEGVDLSVAIARSRNQDSMSDLSVIYNRQLFGVFAKSAYPITTIMAAAKLANAYACAHAEKTVMIVPFGTPEIIKYTKPHQMEYQLSGIPLTAHKKLDLKVPGGFKDEFSNCTIYQHIPPTDISAGVPNLTVEDSLLTRYVTIISVVRGSYDTATHIVNYKTGGMYELPIFSDANTMNGRTVDASDYLGAAFKDTNTSGLFLRRTRFKMRSGILAAPGSDTGELLYAYSSCSVSTNPSTELGKLGLRVYLGAIIKEPNNIFILPNIAFESVVEDGIMPVEKFASHSLPHTSKDDTEDHVWKYEDDRDPALSANFTASVGSVGEYIPIYKDGEITNLNDMMQPSEMDDNRASYNINLDDCSVFTAEGARVIHNSGSLGELDHPSRVGRLNGLVEFTEYGPTEPR